MTQPKTQSKGLLQALSSLWTQLPIMIGVSVAVIAWSLGKPIEYIVLPLLATFGWVTTCILMGKSSGPIPPKYPLRQQLLESLDPANPAGWRPCPAAELTAPAA